MKRRSFIGSTLTTGMTGAITLSCKGKNLSDFNHQQGTTFNHEKHLPDIIAGVTLKEHWEDYHRRLFDRYLPFWDKGGIDKESGGVICLLNDDGSVAEDDIWNWYQGRALWVYSFLYNNFGQEPKYLEIARKIRDFMVKYMKADKGMWYERVYHDGKLKEGVVANIYGWLFAANGLAEYYKATHNDEDINMVYETIRSALKAYDNPGYKGLSNYGGYGEEVSFTGLRSQGHSMVLIHLLSQLMNHTKNSEMESILTKHVDYVMNKFFNSGLGVTNEFLLHDYTRIPGYEDYMYTGHSFETMWMIMFEAIRTKNHELFTKTKNIIHRYIELSWDYVFEGFGDGHFYVFDGPGRTREKLYGVKSMWSHCELLIALLHVIEYTGDQWAQEWYDRVWPYTITSFDTDYGVWRQAVDRSGRDLKREGVPSKRKCNFHQPRCLMLNLMCLDRMMRNKGELTSFSG